MAFKQLNLQLFAGEGAAGAGNGGGEGATGVTAADAGQTQEARLLELGVPQEKIRKRALKPAVKLPDGAVRKETPPGKAQGEKAQDAAAAAKEPKDAEEKPDGNGKESGAASPRLSWEEIMADPEYNKEMQSVVQARLKSSKAAEETLAKLGPALELMARKYGLDPENVDVDALTKAVNADSQYYEERALELGVPVETAMKIDQSEREAARKQREEAKTLEQQKIQNHLSKLHQQGEALKKTFPTFDLRKELQNPAFARMTAPSVGISVEDAYYAIHRNEIQAAAMQATAQKAAQKISNSIQSGQRRPEEAGASGMAPSVTVFDYAHASKEQREALKRAIREASARGEKLYPGR